MNYVKVRYSCRKDKNNCSLPFLYLLGYFRRKRRGIVIALSSSSAASGNPQFLDLVFPFFVLEFSKSSCSRALAPACGAVVEIRFLLLVFNP